MQEQDRHLPCSWEPRDVHATTADVEVDVVAESLMPRLLKPPTPLGRKPLHERRLEPCVPSSEGGKVGHRVSLKRPGSSTGRTFVLIWTTSCGPQGTTQPEE